MCRDTTYNPEYRCWVSQIKEVTSDFMSLLLQVQEAWTDLAGRIRNRPSPPNSLSPCESLRFSALTCNLPMDFAVGPRTEKTRHHDVRCHRREAVRASAVLHEHGSPARDGTTTATVLIRAIFSGGL